MSEEEIKQEKEDFVFLFFSQKEKIYYTEPIAQIQANIENDLAQNPNDIKKLLILAQILSKYNLKEKESLLIYKKILQLDPTNIDARIDLILIWIQKQEYQNCQAVLDECFKLDDQYWRVYYMQSLKFLFENNGTLSKLYINNYYFMFPNEPWIIAFIAQQISENPSQLKRVEKLLDQVISMNKLDYELALRIASTYGIINKTDLQEKYLQIAISLNPNSQKANNNLGHYYRVVKKDMETCEQYCEKAKEIDPFYEVAYYNLSMCAQKKNDYEKSLFYLQKCYQLNKMNVQRLESLASNCFYYQKHIKQYVNLIIQKLLKRDPKSQYGIYLQIYIKQYQQQNAFDNQDLENDEKYQLSLLNVIKDKGSKYNFIQYPLITEFANHLYNIHVD